jgi:hypothetical protein
LDGQNLIREKKWNDMVTVTLKFNEEKLKNRGRTVDEMLEPIRKTLAHFHIEEIEQGGTYFLQ